MYYVISLCWLGRCSTSVTRSVPVNDRPLSSTDSGHWDRQALCIQSAGRGLDSGQAELALLERDVRDPGVRHAGEWVCVTVTECVRWVGGSVCVWLCEWEWLSVSGWEYVWVGMTECENVWVRVCVSGNDWVWQCDWLSVIVTECDCNWVCEWVSVTMTECECDWVWATECDWMSVTWVSVREGVSLG